MVALPDVNVLVALAWPVHVHHDLVHEWLAGHGDQQWATCPLTPGPDQGQAVAVIA